MRGRPSRLTDEMRRRLNREAEIVAAHTPYKQLAAELGLTEGYIANYINRTLRARIKVRKTSNTDE